MFGIPVTPSLIVGQLFFFCFVRGASTGFFFPTTPPSPYTPVTFLGSDDFAQSSFERSGFACGFFSFC